MSGKGEGAHPGLPMKQRHVYKSMQALKRVLCNTSPPYLEVAGVEGKAYVYAVRLDVRGIRPEDLAGAIDALFPEGAKLEVARVHKWYVEACILLGRYLVYDLRDKHGKPVWSLEDLKEFNRLAPTRHLVKKKLRVIDPARFDLFLAWVHLLKPELWAAMWAMRHIGFRFGGMRGAARELSLPYPRSTFKIENGTWTITEKVYPRSFDVPAHVATFLKEWGAELGKLHPGAEWLFPSSRGTQWAESDSSFNKAMRLHWRAWLEATSQVVSEDEVAMVHAHMCRHICATHLAIESVPPAIIKEYMGHRDLRTTQDYIDIVSSKQVSEIDAAHSQLNGHVEDRVEQHGSDKLSVIRGLLAGLSPEDRKAFALKVLTEAMA